MSTTPVDPPTHDPRAAAAPPHPLRLAQDGFAERLAVLAHGDAATLVEVELAPGGGVPLHVHRGYAEHFEVIEGRLEIGLADETVQLAAGQRSSAPAMVPHRFGNGSDAPVRFRVELRPGHRGFLEMQLAFFGLRADGRTGPDGAPRDPRHVAVAFGWSGTAPADRVPAALMRALRLIARITGEERRLRERYVRPAEDRIAALPPEAPRED